MTPTYRDEEIEGRSYKDYGYSPVPVSPSSTLFDNTNPAKAYVQPNTIRHKELNGTSLLDADTDRYEDMAEKSSTFYQYLAAATGKYTISKEKLNFLG